MPKKKHLPGFYWHVHHDVLIEFCRNYDERADYIRTQKPRKERGLRLRLFQPVKGNLLDAITKKWAAYDKARIAYVRACDDYYYNNVYAKALPQMGDAHNKARDAFYRALKAHRAEIEVLHKLEHPNCPWNGYTIFP